MNFVMELSCKDFLHQHAFSRGLSCGGDLIEKIMECANSLAGEPLKEEDRGQFVCLPDAANHLETIHAGHHYICHYDIRFLCKEGT